MEKDLTSKVNLSKLFVVVAVAAACGALHGMADFLTRCVAETNGLWLSTFSASPEQIHRRKMRKTHGVYCHTVGCAFDQQMIEVNNAALVRFGGKPWQDVIVRKE